MATTTYPCWAKTLSPHSESALPSPMNSSNSLFKFHLFDHASSQAPSGPPWIANKIGHFFFSPSLKPGGFSSHPCTFFPSAPSNQKSLPSSKLLPLSALAAKRVSCSTSGLPLSLRPRSAKTSFGLVSDEREKMRRPFESGWIADAEPVEVISRGLRNSAEREGSLEELDGVSGTGREKILTRAWSLAVKKTVLSSCANC